MVASRSTATARPKPICWSMTRRPAANPPKTVGSARRRTQPDSTRLDSRLGGVPDGEDSKYAPGREGPDPAWAGEPANVGAEGRVPGLRAYEDEDGHWAGGAFFLRRLRPRRARGAAHASHRSPPRGSAVAARSCPGTY
jgi:hypothetical protein